MFTVSFIASILLEHPVLNAV